MDYSDWARKNKKRVARELIRKLDVASSEHPSGIFTAGLPGAGKTEFTVELLKEIIGSPLRIDMDEIATLIEGYRPEIANKFRLGASMILGRIYDETVKNKIDFVFDGTFGHERAIENFERALKQKYTVKVYFIHQDPALAWGFTKDRELIERRSINKESFLGTYSSLFENIRTLQNSYKNVTISIVVKDKQNKIGQRFENVDDIFSIIPKPLARDELERVIFE